MALGRNGVGFLGLCYDMSKDLVTMMFLDR
jgi:hypothetical protein